MSRIGYQINAPCRLTYEHRHGSASVSARLVHLVSDGALLLCETPIPVDIKAQLQFADLNVPEQRVRVSDNQGDVGFGYRLWIRLVHGTWPYQVFVSFAEAGTRGRTHAAPPCLQELGLRMPCTANEIRSAFDRLVRRVHPDRGGALEDFVRLRTAYVEALRLVGGAR